MYAVLVGGTACAVIIGANEVAVGLFLHDQIGFNDIPKLVAKARERVAVFQNPDLEQILEADHLARLAVLEGR